MQDNAADVAAAAQAAEAAQAGAVASFAVLFVYVIVGIIYAVVVYFVARKRGVNPWPWAIPTLIPVLGMMIAAIFMILSFLSVLDRLNALENRETFS